MEFMAFMLDVFREIMKILILIFIVRVHTVLLRKRKFLVFCFDGL